MYAFTNRLSNMLGYFSADCRKRINAVIQNPSQETWEDAHSIIINGRDTLWQAWIAVDSLAPKSKPLDAPWPEIPSQVMIYKALRYAASPDNA